jgi:tRNA (cytidine/uridine-2'-O-)-methyltransferase
MQSNDRCAPTAHCYVPDSLTTPGVAKTDRRCHVVLVAPEVHWNTGNIGRSCLGAGAALHLIRPLGFSLESRQVKRAGLDYWSKVDLTVWDDFEAFAVQMAPQENEMALLTKRGAAPYWQITPAARQFLIFGSETGGLPASLLARYAQRTFFIPISDQIRCLNLSTAAGIVLYDIQRRCRVQPSAR